MRYLSCMITLYTIKPPVYTIKPPVSRQPYHAALSRQGYQFWWGCLIKSVV